MDDALKPMLGLLLFSQQGEHVVNADIACIRCASAAVSSALAEGFVPDSAASLSPLSASQLHQPWCPWYHTAIAAYTLLLPPLAITGC